MDNKKIFDQIAKNYINKWDKSINEENNIKKIIKLCGLKKGDTILEPGCGKGDFSIYILKKIGKDGFLYANDISKKMLFWTRKKFKNIKNIKIINCDAKKIKTCKIDKIICFNCFPHFYPKKEYIKRFYQLLKEKGFLIIAHSIARKKVNKLHKNYGFDIKKHYLASADEMEKILKKYQFKIIKKYDADFYFIKAKKHKFMI